MNAYPDTLSFRELDQKLGLAKGSAFRAFKCIEAGLREGDDYFLLKAGEDAAAIAQLRAQGRVYAISRNVVLLSAVTSARVLELLKKAGGSLE